MDFIFIIAILIMSVVVHEVSHGFAALWLGDPTAKYEGRLTMNPFKHLDPIGSVLVPIVGYLSGGILVGWARPVPFNPYNLTRFKNKNWSEALVAIAGPLSNIVLAIIFAVLLNLSASLDIALVHSPKFLFLAQYLILINIVLAVFNLVPIPPLDGSKILFALFPSQLRPLRNFLEQYGFVLVLIFIFFFWQVISPIAYGIFELLVDTT